MDWELSGMLLGGEQQDTAGGAEVQREVLEA